MRLIALILSAAAAAAVAVAGVGVAVAQARSAPVVVRPAVTTWTAGKTYTVRVTVRQRGRYSLWLSTDRRRSARDRHLRTVRLPTRRGRRASTVRVRTPRLRAGRWWLLACARASRRCAAARVHLRAPTPVPSAPAEPPARKGQSHIRQARPGQPQAALPKTGPMADMLSKLFRKGGE